jgi:hypothetical protein
LALRLHRPVAGKNWSVELRESVSLKAELGFKRFAVEFHEFVELKLALELQ